ncbi:Hypothetical_protein [Hexamita inflata]|uniref:Hypothetical_protein n=1 Tax=Hexamita inflata TaxID=28002 RepID=A0AA86TRN3_9EUKA|nr:Hypothetical protein HINF_LOCUS13621 [Hexamita inflata]CAI9925992.1 Hypothetical protein HINF_LOCUS13637 [Hexamita inflata]CAI9933913.1 Hypothetical protein HINF_LOCUS21558 [Hexamita inflata]
MLPLADESNINSQVKLIFQISNIEQITKQLKLKNFCLDFCQDILKLIGTKLDELTLDQQQKLVYICLNQQSLSQQDIRYVLKMNIFSQQIHYERLYDVLHDLKVKIEPEDVKQLTLELGKDGSIDYLTYKSILEELI